MTNPPRARRALDTVERIAAATGRPREVLYAALIGGLSVYVDDETWDANLAGLEPAATVVRMTMPPLPETLATIHAELGPDVVVVVEAAS